MSGLNIPVYESGKVLAVNARSAHCVVPAFEYIHEALTQVIGWSLALLSGVPRASEARLKAAIEVLALLPAKSAAVPGFVAAALDIGKPFFRTQPVYTNTAGHVGLGGLTVR